MNDEDERQVQTAIRLPEEWLERLVKLAEKLSSPGLRITRSEVLRLAVHRGLIAMEGEADGRDKAELGSLRRKGKLTA